LKVNRRVPATAIEPLLPTPKSGPPSCWFPPPTFGPTMGSSLRSAGFFFSVRFFFCFYLKKCKMDESERMVLAPARRQSWDFFFFLGQHLTNAANRGPRPGPRNRRQSGNPVSESPGLVHRGAGESKKILPPEEGPVLERPRHPGSLASRVLASFSFLRRVSAWGL